VFVEGKEGTNEDATVLEMATHAVVDMHQHLTALTDLRHLEGSGWSATNRILNISDYM